MNHAIILAAGKGKRFGKMNKLLSMLEQKTILGHAIEKFEKCNEIDDIILVVNEDSKDKIKQITAQYKKIKKIVIGGKKRQDSVFNGIKAIEGKDDDIVLIHNGDNPFVSPAIIEEAINNARKFGACAVAMPATDTIKIVENGFVAKTLDRTKVWLMQTPQAMTYKIAKEAFSKALKDSFYGTDDAALVERLGKKVKIIQSNSGNIKITTKQDLFHAKNMIEASRIGIGQDSHAFGHRKKPLMLGGIAIKDWPGLKANSDGDVVLHALFNALSSAIGGRSLGFYADLLCKRGITDSKKYLEIALSMLEKEDYKISNIAIMLEAKKPILENYEEKIKSSIAKLCFIAKKDVGITVTSGEELTPFGQGKAMQAFAMVSLKKKIN